MAVINEMIFISLTQDRAKKVISYNPETGSLIWENPSCKSMKKGDMAGTVPTLYGIDG